MLNVYDIKTHAMTYIGQHTRQAQNLVQIYHCIYNSINLYAYLNILAETHNYTVKFVELGIIRFSFFTLS